MRQLEVAKLGGDRLLEPARGGGPGRAQRRGGLGRRLTSCGRTRFKPARSVLAALGRREQLARAVEVSDRLLDRTVPPRDPGEQIEALLDLRQSPLVDADARRVAPRIEGELTQHIDQRYRPLRERRQSGIEAPEGTSVDRSDGDDVRRPGLVP